jgi:hypothetical protein
MSLDEDKIINALRDKRWDYRTADGIAKETGIPLETVKNFLESRKGTVWKSSIPDRFGRDLYTHNDRRPQNKEFWRNLSTFGSKSSS